jgi:hypothetical protein
VKEILGKKIENFVQSEVDPETVAFKDKNQESQYLQKRDNTVAKKGIYLAGKIRFHFNHSFFC